MHNCFYTGSLNHRATSNFPGQLEPGFHYIQKFYKSNTKITLLNTKHTRLLIHNKKSRTSTYKNHTCRPEITSGKPSRGIRTSKPDGGCS